MIYKKTAIIYDWIDKWGGVERLLLVLYQLFPQADFFTSYYDLSRATWAKKLMIKSSFIQKLPTLFKMSRLLSFPLYPLAFESFNFSDYNLVISVTSSFAKGIITLPGTDHICYLLTPTRYLWLYPQHYIQPRFLRSLLFPYINQMKHWDYQAAQRPDKIISISKTVANRCREFYRRDSEIIYPPFDLKYWREIKSQLTEKELHKNYKSQISNYSYFLVVSRLEPYKRIDLVIRLFNQLNQHLIIVGEGSEEKKLKAIAGKKIHFYKRLTDEQLAVYYKKAYALIMPQEEDFGYVSLEAQLFGCPVIAYKKGGAGETIVNNSTGIFFNDQSERSLRSALESYKKIAYNLRYGMKNRGEDHLVRFSKDQFIKNFKIICGL